MTGRSTVVLEEGKITGSFIKVYCNAEHVCVRINLSFYSKYEQSFRAFGKKKIKQFFPRKKEK